MNRSVPGLAKAARTYAFVILISLCAVAGAWRLVVVTFSQHYAYSDPATAIWWDRGDPGALVSMAGKLLGDVKTTDAADRAKKLAIEALRMEPMAPGAYDVLGLLSEREGRAGLASKLFRISESFSPRDLAAEGWLYAAALRTGDLQAAVSRLDRIIRTHPETGETLIGAIAPFLDVPGLNAALAAKLDTGPPWRSWFLGMLERQGRNRPGLLSLYAALQAGPSGLSATELSAYLSGLIAAGRLDQAYLAWLKTLPPGRLSELSYLYNGHFRFPVSQTPFDWTIVPVAGAAVEIGPGEKGEALSAGFYGPAIPFHNVTHDLLLPPGPYRLKGLVKADHFEAAEGMRWRIGCLEKPDGEIGSSRPLRGDAPWQPFSMDFDVPESDCAGQKLVLELPGSATPNQRTSGVVSYSALEIEAR